jgi:hypothetical protein
MKRKVYFVHCTKMLFFDATYSPTLANAGFIGLATKAKTVYKS